MTRKKYRSTEITVEMLTAINEAISAFCDYDETLGIRFYSLSMNLSEAFIASVVRGQATSVSRKGGAKLLGDLINRIPAAQVAKAMKDLGYRENDLEQPFFTSIDASAHRGTETTAKLPTNGNTPSEKTKNWLKNLEATVAVLHDDIRDACVRSGVEMIRSNE